MKVWSNQKPTLAVISRQAVYYNKQNLLILMTFSSANVVGTLPENVVLETGPGGDDLFVAKKQVADATYEVSGNTGFSGKTLTKSEVNVETKKGETTSVSVNSNFKQTNIQNEGKGSLQVNVVGSSFKEGKVIGGKQSDIVSFDANSSVLKATMKLGKGSDSITFAKGSKVRGRNVIDLGKGGKDSVVIEDLNNIKGTLIIRKFGNKDTVTVNGKVYSYSEREALNNLDGIKIKG
jgi:hypothetical protein